jgi:lycopene beta-cyclase
VKAKLVLVGGGLANSLIAYRILSVDPSFPLLVVEREGSLGANHTWSFHDSDLTTAQLEWIRPLVAHSWAAHELRFPRRHRVFHGRYNTIRSELLHEVVAGVLGDRALLGIEVVDVSPERVRLADGTSIEAHAVIDGRGDPGGHHLEIAYQKFVGAFVRLAHDHGLGGPILMDATVEQLDGYRFVYTLPFSARELLIEDTYYSDRPGLDRARLHAAIQAYALHQGWEITEITGDEGGVLPIVLGGDIQGFWGRGPSGVARSGMRAAFFHPTTGYSLPEAVALADELTPLRHLDGRALHDLTRRRSVDLWRHTAYYRLLNRMLFRAAVPEQRYRIFERFYGLSDPLIRRFYAGRLKWTDKVRLLIGKPPVPLIPALRCLLPAPRGTNDAIESKAEEDT